MKQVVVLSGKGGTGKTTVAAALSHLASRHQRAVLVDADVDASNLGLLLSPETVEKHSFFGSEIALVDEPKCNGCGACMEACRSDAIVFDGTARVEPALCEGCRACLYRCPEDAIRMEPERSGFWFSSDTRFGPLFHAHLLPGQENSGKLVTEVRRAGGSWAKEKGIELVLIDGPPGIGCPVIAASTGVDLALMVAEPTLSSAHDLKRALETVRHFDLTPMVCINKEDLNRSQAESIRQYCRDEGIEVAGQIPFDPAVHRAVVAGRPVTESATNGIQSAFLHIWTRVRDRLNGT